MIAIIEDCRNTRELLKKIISTCTKTEICQFETAEEFTKYIFEKGNLFQSIFVDIDLPGESGIQMLKNLQEILCGSTCQIIICSAHLNRKNVFEAVSAGAGEFIHKPFNKDDIIGVLLNNNIRNI